VDEAAGGANNASDAVERTRSVLTFSAEEAASATAGATASDGFAAATIAGETGEVREGVSLRRLSAADVSTVGSAVTSSVVGCTDSVGSNDTTGFSPDSLHSLGPSQVTSKSRIAVTTSRNPPIVFFIVKHRGSTKGRETGP
jgi:hypothetical protein